MEFVVLILALGLATGVAGLRLSFGAHGRIRAAQRLHDRQMDGARRRIVQLEAALVDADAIRMRAQDSALQGRRRHADLMAAVSRQMRSPLEGVLGFSDLLRLNAAGEPLSHRQRQAVERIREAAARLLILVEGMNTLAGAERPVPAVLQAVDPLLLAHKVCLAFEIEATAAGVLLTLPEPKPGLTALADPERLTRILSALIANAVRHNRPGGTVTIEGRRVGAEIQVTVRDSGPGLSSAQLETLFEPFTLPAIAAGRVSGAGLAAARGLAEAMQGRVEAESVEGQGAAFTVSLAAALAAPSDAAGRSEGLLADLPRMPSGVHLYIARDAAAVALMRRLTQDFGGLQLHVAASVDEGAALARDLRPDALILDLDLAEDGGAAFLKALRTDPTRRPTPVLALTSDAQALCADGVAELLRRPVSLADLTATLARLLNQSATEFCDARVARTTS